MPDMNGLDFLKKIKESPVKKVLVTSESDYTIAIDAFNNGIIDAYIRKDSPDFLTKLQHITTELEWKYFTNLSKITSELSEFDYLKNSNIIKFFTDFLTDKNSIGFYLSDKQGAFCTYDATGEKEYFVIRNTMQLKQLSEFAAEDGASEKTINDLAKAKTIPFFNFKKHWEIPANEWDSYLYSANELPGDADYLWTSVKPKFLIMDNHS
jgi:response regulator RpfG family c-di-GMP phosphodiesterase